MDVMWQKTNYKSRQLVSLVFSVFIILMILAIPIEYRFNLNRHEKLIDISLVKNITTEVIPESVLLSPVKNQLETTQRPRSNVPVVHRKTTSGVKDTFTVNQSNQQKTTLTPQKMTQLSDNGKQSYSKKSRSQLLEIDNNSLVDTEKKDTFKHPLLVDREKKRLEMMEKLRKERLNARQSKIVIDMPAILIAQPRLMPVSRKKKKGRN